MAANKLFRVGHKLFNAKNLLGFSAWIEEEYAGDRVIFSDLIFIEMSEGYNASKKISMRVRAIDLRALAYGIKEIIKTGASRFEKYTEPNLAGASGEKKKLSLNVSGDIIFLNISEGSTNISYSADAYNFASLADSITFLAEETDKMLYWFQRNPSRI